MDSDSRGQKLNFLHQKYFYQPHLLPSCAEAT